MRLGLSGRLDLSLSGVGRHDLQMKQVRGRRRDGGGKLSKPRHVLWASVVITKAASIRTQEFHSGFSGLHHVSVPTRQERVEALRRLPGMHMLQYGLQVFGHAVDVDHIVCRQSRSESHETSLCNGHTPECLAPPFCFCASGAEDSTFPLPRSSLRRDCAGYSTLPSDLMTRSLTTVQSERSLTSMFLLFDVR